MTLTVVASADPDRPLRRTDGYVLRLIGAHEAGDVAPPGLLDIADRAAAHLREIFPGWLWRWAQASGVLTLATEPGPISWWWYSPISEMSPIRSPLITKLYWLLLLRDVVEQHHIDHVEWIGDDPALADVAREVMTAQGVAFEAQLSGRYRGDGVWRQLARRVVFGVKHVSRSLALRWAGFGTIDRPDADVLLYSRFPVLWEAAANGGRERMFADWPDVLESRGHAVIFGAVFSGSLRQILARRHEWLIQCRERRILLIEALVSVRTLISAHCDVRFLGTYLRWRRRQPPVVFDRIDISALFWREMDASATSTEIPFDRVLAAGVGRVLDGQARVTTVCLPFEYQPMERAVCLTAQRRGRSVIGLQTGLYTSNQMGFTFPVEQVRTEPDDATRAPLPDAIAAYGELPQRVFAERLGSDRVFRVGPIRYAHLAQPPRAGHEELRRSHQLPADAMVVLVTTSTVKAESSYILESAFHAASVTPGVFLALKFHYHLALHDQVARLTQRYPGVSSRIFESHLDDLLFVSAAMVCGGSSTGIEAIARGCMPLVFRSVGDVLPNPMLDVADAVFFWQTPQELVQVMSAALAGNEACATRRARWPSALRAQLSPLAIDMNTRLYDFLLDHRLLLTPAREASGAHQADRVAHTD